MQAETSRENSVTENVVVFVGPSLSAEEVLELSPSVIIRPPARRGSVYELIGCGVDKALVIDGIFYNAPSLWHREILTAMESGIRVYGASSLGALRAAELGPYGMTGIGWIYNRYLDGTIDGDDEVSLLHLSEQYGYRGLSMPLVNLRMNLEHASKLGIVSSSEESMILAEFKSHPFYNRTEELFLKAPRLKEVRSISDGSLLSLFRHHWIDIKAIDARLALEVASKSRETRGAKGNKCPRRELRPDYVIAAIREHTPSAKRSQDDGIPDKDTAREVKAGIACAILHFSEMVLCILPRVSPAEHQGKLAQGPSESESTILAVINDLIAIATSQIGIADSGLQIAVSSKPTAETCEINYMLILLVGWLLEINQCDPDPVEERAIGNYVKSLELPAMLKVPSNYIRLVRGLWFCEKRPDYFGLSSWQDPVFYAVADGIEAARGEVAT